MTAMCAFALTYLLSIRQIVAEFRNTVRQSLNLSHNETSSTLKWLGLALPDQRALTIALSNSNRLVAMIVSRWHHLEAV